MNEYIKKAIELSDWWNSGIAESIVITNAIDDRCEEQWFRDLLAAQLRKQAQANPHIVFKITVVDSACYVEMTIYNPNGDEEAEPLRFVGHETEEAMAFIKPIIDSGILT